MFGAILAVGVSWMSWTSWDIGEGWLVIIKKIFLAKKEQLPEMLCVIAAILSTLPYYFYYTLKNSTRWNECYGKSDNWGWIKIFGLYEISIMGVFYLLLQNLPISNDAFCAPKPIVSSIGAVFCIVYIAILCKRRKQEHIGYFAFVIVLALLLFLALTAGGFVKLWKVRNHEYAALIIFFVLFLLNAAVNLFFLFKFDSSAETGIISNRIGIIVPMLSMPVFPASMIYSYHMCGKDGKNLWPMLIFSLVITVYEVMISLIKCYDARIKILLCVISFMSFIIGIMVAISGFVADDVAEDLSEKWLLAICACIYLIAIKYLGHILKLLRQQEGVRKPNIKIMNAIVWFRNSILGSVLFILVIFVKARKYLLLLVVIMLCAAVMGCFVRYMFGKSRKIDLNVLYKRGKVIEFLAVALLIAACAAENIFGITQIIKDLWHKQSSWGMILIGCFALFVLLGLFAHILSLYNKDEWKRLPKLEKEQIHKHLGNRIYKIKKLTFSVLPSKYVEDFWMAALTWGFYIVIVLFSICYFAKPPFYAVEKGGIVLLIIIIEADWLLLSRDIFRYYEEKMKDGKAMMKYKDIFEKEWKKTIEKLKVFKESDAKQFKVGSYLRPIMFFFGSNLLSS